MRITIREAHMENVKLSVKESGGGADTGATLHIKAPFTGGWPQDFKLRFSNEPEDTAVEPGGFLLPALGKDEPVSITFYGMDVQNGTPTKGERLFKVSSALAKSGSIKKVSGVPVFSGAYYVSSEVQHLSDWFTTNPSYTGFVVVESLNQDLFDDDEDEDE